MKIGATNEKNLVRRAGDLDIPDPLVAASIDVNDPLHPLLVGGGSALPSGAELSLALGSAVVGEDGTSFDVAAPDSLMIWPETEYE